MRLRWGVLAVAALVAGCTGGTRAPRDSPALSSGSESAHVLATIEIGRSHDIEVAGKYLWSADYENGTLVRLDIADRTTQVFELSDELGYNPADLHLDGREIWLVSHDHSSVGHFDMRTSETSHVARVGRSGLMDSALRDDELWIVHSGRGPDALALKAYGITILSASKAVPLPGRFSAFSDIAAGDVGVWALSESSRSLAAVSSKLSRTGVVATDDSIMAGGSVDIAVGLGYVWIISSDGETTDLTRYDPSEHDFVTRSVPGGGQDLVLGKGEAWVLTAKDDDGARLWRFDAESFESGEQVISLAGDHRSARLAYSDGSVWVTHDINLVSQIDVAGGPPPTGPIPTAEKRGNGEVCGQAVWVDCRQAFWLRRVLVSADAQVLGDTGSAFEIEIAGRDLYAWNTQGEREIAEVARAEGYEPIDGSDAFSDGDRIVWEAQGMHIYLSPADGRSIDDLSLPALDNLIARSMTEPTEVDLSGALPQPQPTAEARYEDLPDGRVRVWPVTEDVPNEGKYRFAAPHCGLDWFIDFDGSFWDAIEPDDYGDGRFYPFFYNSDEGAITFVGDDSAFYQASTGEEIELRRLNGPIAVQPCA